MMRIGVVIPFVQDTYIGPLLNCIERNSVRPDEIIMIDNSKKDTKLQITHLHLQHFRPSSPLGVNASWNYGIKELIEKDCDLISILNDDLLVEDLFFEKLIRLASKHPEAGVLCPETLRSPEALKNALPIGSESVCGMKKREGWAWTIRASLARTIPPIPGEMKTFCGDDWYWHRCRAQGRPWMKMINNRCFHYVGQSTVLMDVRKDLRVEKSIMSTLL